MSAQTLQKLAAYTSWANERVLTVLESLGNQVPATSLHLLSHLLNAQAVWLARIEERKSPVGVFDDHTLAECRALHESTSGRLLSLAASPPQDLVAVITYTNTQNEFFKTSLHDILTHVFNHGTYHRAQIARDLRQNGLEPINTDYITFVRETGHDSL